MVSTKKDPVLVAVALSGGNDGMNNVIPFTNPHYRDRRPRPGDSRRPDYSLYR